MTTAFQRHVQRWSNCKLCPLHKTRANVVLARGKVPCDVLLCGEAPGESENVLGRPFVGPAGQLLDYVLARAVPSNVRYALTNLVSCVPREEDGSKTSEPPVEAVDACSARLVEFVALCNPKLIVAVGNMARDWLDPKFKNNVPVPPNIPQVHIVHPAAVLRANVAARGLMIQRAIVTVANAIEEHVTGVGGIGYTSGG